MRASIVLVLVSVLLAGCPSAGPIRSAAVYPAEIPGFTEYEKFPAEAAGFRRSKVLAYAPALADYSVGYNRFDQQLQNAVTLYFYPKPAEATVAVASEVAGVTSAHAGSRVVSQRSVAVEQEGHTYQATVVTFEYTESFAGKRQEVWSQLMLVFLPNRTFKVRSTAPVAQGAFAEGKLGQLLEVVVWTR